MGVHTTTLYRPARAQLSEDDKRNLKLLNVCDPYLHEFFFGGRQIIVEGDTEYTAFSMLKQYYPSDYQDVQIIRARGKGIIPSVARVLLQFAAGFSVLHDSDKPQTSKGNANPAWGMNKTIADILEWENADDRVRLIACKPNFELAVFGEAAIEDKPYNALYRIQTDESSLNVVKQLLDSLLNPDISPPAGCVRWKEISDLE